MRSGERWRWWGRRGSDFFWTVCAWVLGVVVVVGAAPSGRAARDALATMALQDCTAAVTLEGFLQLDCAGTAPFVTALRVQPVAAPDGIVAGIAYKVLGATDFFAGQQNCRQAGYQVCDAGQLAAIKDVLQERWVWYWAGSGVCATDLNTVVEVKAWAMSQLDGRWVLKCLPASTARTIEEFDLVAVCCQSAAARAP